jgi:hypothetical protein
VKRSLPTLPAGRAQGRGHGHNQHDRNAWRTAERAVPLAERSALDLPLIAVAHVNQAAAAARLATQLCAAFVREGVAVSALVTIDSTASAPEAEAALATMLEAGARQTVLLRKPERDAQAALTHALEQLAGSEWIVAFGNTLPQLFRPYFTVVVTGHRRALTGAEPLVLQAELEVTAPGDELATLLARRLQTQWAERQLEAQPSPERES